MGVKAIPNILSVLRIVLSGALVFLAPPSILFFAVYLLCALSDVLDGYLARRLGAESKAGATLDTIADLAFLVAIFVTVFRCFEVPVWLIIWIALIAIMRFAAWPISMRRYSGLIVHTSLDKIVGVLLFFLLPAASLPQIGLVIPAVIVSIAASLCTLENLAIVLSSKTADESTRSYFLLK